MAKASKYLLEAQARYKPAFEDRLTEIFATTLAIDGDLTRSFLAQLGVSVADGYDVETQVQTAAGTRVDMQIRTFQGDATDAVVWCEHKLDSQFNPRQHDYPTLLARLGANSTTTVAIVPQSDRVPPGWRGMTWYEIAGMVDEVGAQRGGGAGWRPRALESTANAADRVLAEFAWCLEDYDFAVVGPLTPDLVSAWKNLDSAETVLGEILLGAVQRVASHFGWTHDQGTGDSGTMWTCLRSLGEDWFSEWEAVPQLVVSDADDWTPDQTGDALISAGVEFRRRDEAELRLRTDWIQEIGTREFIFTMIDDRYPVCYRNVSLDAVVEAGELLSDQAAYVGEWAIEAFRDLLTLDPGPHAPASKSEHHNSGPTN